MSAINLDYSVEEPESYELFSGELTRLNQKAYQGFLL